MTVEFDAYLALNQQGRFLDDKHLGALPEVEPLRRDYADRLRDALAPVLAGEARGEALAAVLDAVLEEGVGLTAGWRKQLGASDAETLLDGTTHKPRRLYDSASGPALALFVTQASRVGVHKGRVDVAHAIEYLRRRKLPLGLVTNGREWRLLFADADNLAWVEWAADRFLDADTLSPAFELLRRILSLKSLAGPLLVAIRETRRGQAQLSKDLGEGVRAAVELLLKARQPVLAEKWNPSEARDTYNAACHFVMRLVVVLFAEARELLPTDSAIYHSAYGLRGLMESLERAGPERRKSRQQAWPRVLALFQLLHRGSPHPALVVPTYGGELFRPGEANGSAQERALALIESAEHPPADEDLYRLLLKLTRTRLHGQTLPVDFTELTSEYIGILYEGLLDYELHRAGEHPVVFLSVGDRELALPLNRLEEMPDKQLLALVEKSKAAGGDEEEEEEPEEGEEEGETEVPEETAPVIDEPPEFDNERDAARKRALVWGQKAAVLAKLVSAPRGKKGADDPVWKEKAAAAAKRLIANVVLPGELYVVRWGGTRKGAGTFYTRPQLTLPTVRRTLEPLVRNSDGTRKTPEQILSLKVCDPAMGSGSFLVASLRVLTEEVMASLYQHQRLKRRDGSELVSIDCELLPAADRDLSIDRVESIVRRAVVEHCLYGVDLDPLAVELARVSLWVETLDKRLPFTFLDHKLRCGNALIGTWLDRFRDYPLLAWWRQSPDEKWRGVTHEGDVWANQLKELRAAIVEEQRKVLAGEMKLAFAGRSDEELKESIDKVRKLYRDLRAVPSGQPDERARIWRERILPSRDVEAVREAFDTWCALWFWPLEKLELVPRPLDFLAPSDEVKTIVQQVCHEKRFFHWELEFPDVFTEKGAGFDVIVANPPWETLQPQSKEFFSDLDPLYRSYGKQEALQKQREFFAKDARVEQRWLRYIGGFKDIASFVGNVGEPFGNSARGAVALVPRKPKESEALHKKWSAERSRKTGLSSPEHAFRHQGEGKPYSYKLFVEQAHALLKTGGQLGLITPSGLYTDKGAVDLRRLLLDRSAWRWLYGFENRDKVFDIHRSFKFAVTIAQKGGSTTALHAAFMRHDLSDWAEAKGVLAYPAERIHSFSPKSLSVLEIRSERDLEVLTKIYANSVLLGDDGSEGWGIKYAQGDFNMTSDSKLFIPREKAEEAGYLADAYGRWIGKDGDVLLPLYQGAMIHQHDFAYKGWLAVDSKAANWVETPFPEKRIVPKFLVRESDYEAARSQEVRAGFRDIARSTDQRTMIAAALPSFPCGNKVPFLRSADAFALVGSLDSYSYDWTQRTRQGSTAVNYFILSEAPLMRVAHAHDLRASSLRLGASDIRFAAQWLAAGVSRDVSWRRQWAVTRHERLRLRCILDAIVATRLGLSRDDLRWILRECDHPSDSMSNMAFRRGLQATGFWRVDKDEDPELRHTVLTLVAFDSLSALIDQHGGNRDAGIAAFSALNEGEGWLLPETLCLKDHDLGHDARAEVAQPVASRLGPRFLDWQLAQTPEQSWAECEKHARAILGEEEFNRRFGRKPPEKFLTMFGQPRPEQPIKVPEMPVQPQLGFTFTDAPKTGAKNGTATSEPLPMTISNIRLLNFRNWGEEHKEKGVELKPITLVLGRNSAGKTSILQPLRMLKQTIDATDAGTQLLLDGTKADGVNLGAYTDVVHDHDAKKELGVGFDIAEAGISVDVRFKQVAERPVIESLAYRWGGEKVEVTRTTNAFQLASPRFRLPNWDGDKNVQNPQKGYEPGRAVEFSEAALGDMGTLGRELRDAIVKVKNTFNTFYYLGALRPPPLRQVTWSQQDPTRLGSNGSETVQALISNQTGKGKGALLKAVGEWLKRLDLADGIEIERVGRTLLYEVMITRSPNRSNLADVGYGVSQVLPVITLLHFVPEGSVILCEDPEAHLHPMAQARLADLFVEVAKQRKLQILLETHSEHLFRRLQYLIAANEVRSQDCALYYVERDEPSAKLTVLQADEFGRLTNWPENFFGDAIGETERQMRKMIERMKAPARG